MIWKEPAWIVTAPRTGSTYLCYLLNSFAGLPFDLVEDADRDRDIFGEHYQLYRRDNQIDVAGSPPRVTKVHWHWLHRDGLQVPSNRKIVLRRRDRIAQAISLYFGNATKTAHCSNELQLAEWKRKPVKWNPDKALSCLRQVTHWDEKLAQIDGLSVFYEDLKKNPLSVVSYCFGYMVTAMHIGAVDIHQRLKVPLYRLNRPEKQQYCEKLRQLAARLKA